MSIQSIREKCMRKLLMLAGLLSGLPAAVHAQDFVPHPGFYIGAGGGLAIALGTNGGNNDRIGYAVGGFLGYDFLGPRVAVEVGYGRIASNTTPAGTSLYGRQIRVMGNVYYDFMPSARFSPYVGAGAGVSFNDSNGAFGSTRFAFQGMIGAVYHVDANWNVGLEARYMGSTDPSFTVGGTTFTYQSHQMAIFAGVAYKFGGAPAAAPPPAPAPGRVTNYMVFFDFDRSNITPTAATTIKQAADDAKAGRRTSIGVTGHADRSGADAYNMALSLRRANAVKDELVRQGIPATGITVVGRGESQPLVQTPDGVREPQNRRVEIVLQ
jgi:OOP family OmpA-OmpF porin